jgi:hypothetical protein
VVTVQWESENKTSKYQNHLNTAKIEIRYSNGPVLRCPVAENQSSEYRSSFQMLAILTTIYSGPDKYVRYSNGLVIRCPVPAKIGIHIPTVLVSSIFRHKYVWFFNVSRYLASGYWMFTVL